MLDLVYPLKPGSDDFAELKYSLRSVEANTQAERVHFFGGKPKWLRTGLHVPTKQPFDKLRNMRVQVRAALDSDEVSDPYWHMNDDMFVMTDLSRTDLHLWHGGDFDEWLRDLGPRYTRIQYMKDARQTAEMVRATANPARVLCWSLHTPILIHKEAMRDALKIDARCDQTLHLRTLYGNLAGLKGQQAPVHDVKQTQAVEVGQVYASTSNATWLTGGLGRQIRAMFPEPSRWERA